MKFVAIILIDTDDSGTTNGETVVNLQLLTTVVAIPRGAEADPAKASLKISMEAFVRKRPIITYRACNLIKILDVLLPFIAKFLLCGRPITTNREFQLPVTVKGVVFLPDSRVIGNWRAI